MEYVYDEILERMVYTVTEDVDLDKAVKCAAVFKEMDRATKDYVLARLLQLAEEPNEDDR